MHDNTKHLFIFGLGYVGSALAEALLQNGWRVSGTTRSADKAKKLSDRGIEVYDMSEQLDTDLLGALASATHIVSTIPPKGSSDALYDAYYHHMVALKDVAWFGYLSSTVIYGDAQGAWIDETTVPCPNSDRGEKRLLAEMRWLKTSLPAHIFRTSGIYGPDRNSLMKVKLGTARPIVKQGHVFCRIHIDDIVAALVASMQEPKAGSIYNLSDDLPAPPYDLISYAAQLLEIPAPAPVAYENAELSPMAKSFYDGCRRVGNDKIKTELGLTLKYPTYKEGLAALLLELG